jgi:TolA-binding protein
MQAGLFSGIRKYNEAIGAYLNSNKQPESLFRISDCYVALRNKEEAVGQLTEIENFFKPVASRAALQIANVYFGFGDDKQGIAALRAVMKKYPGSRESNPAHIELERRGVKMSGGTDAD